MSLPEEPHPLPDDPLLAEVARVLEAGRHTAEVLDSDWRLCYVTTELRQMCGVDDDDGLGYRVTSALRVLARPEAWRASRKSGYEWFQKETPYYLYDHGSEAVEPQLEELIAGHPELRPAPPPPAWSLVFETSLPDGQPITVSRLVVRLLRDDG